MKKLYEADKPKSSPVTPGTDIHVYKDDKTDNVYIYDGKKLILIGNVSPQIGDKGDEQALEKEDEERENQIKKEREESEAAGEEVEPEETEEEKQERLKRIKDMLSNDETGEQATEESERKAAIDKNLRKKKEADDKTSKASSPIQKFKASLDRFLADQVKRQKTKTWKRSDMRYEGSGVMRRGRAFTQNTKIPKINVYFDQSGSWNESDIKVGMEAIGILNNYEKRGEITKSIYYFSNHIYDNADAARRDGGTGAGAELIYHIQATKPDNVIVMTDDDIGGGWNEIYDAPKIKVPGAVWYLFRNDPSPALPTWLQGKKQTKSFII